jgi:hypothetical protein
METTIIHGIVNNHTNRPQESIFSGSSSNPHLKPKSWVTFAQGSGSGKNSPVNQHMASLKLNGFASLLADLLTPVEPKSDTDTKMWRVTGRFPSSA